LRYKSEAEDDESGNDDAGEPELVAVAVRSSKTEVADELPFAPQPRDYASDFGNGVRTLAITEEPGSQPAVSPLSAPSNDEERDLDVPTFMRRMKF
jgi:hypothetical protein